MYSTPLKHELQFTITNSAVLIYLPESYEHM